MVELEGMIILDEDAASGSSVKASMRVAGIDTGNKRRDEHLQTRSFLDAARYPQIQFQSREVTRGTDRDMLRISGPLTIRDKIKEVVLDVTEVDRSKSPSGEEVVYYVAETELNRYDFGVTAWPGVIGRRLKVVINVQASRV